MVALIARDKAKGRTRFARRVCFGCFYLFVAFDVVFVLSFAHSDRKSFPTFDFSSIFAGHLSRRKRASQASTPEPPFSFFMTFEDQTADLGEEDDGYCDVVDAFGCVAVEQFREASEVDQFRWIRIEKEPDPILQDIRQPEDVLEMIEHVKQNQTQYGLCSLYPREWESCKKSDDVYHSGEHVNGLNKNAQGEFSVMQFNALAEGLSSGPSVKKPFVKGPGEKQAKVDPQKSIYGGFSAVPVPSISLDFSLRRWRILEVILGNNLESMFDLVAMEEIDRYRGFFLPLLRLFGYDGRFIPKTRAPGLLHGWYSDGCCLFWKSATFELVSDIRREYAVGNQVYLIATLRHISTGHFVVTAVTHLKAQKGAAQEKIRCHQVDELLNEISKQSQQLLQKGEKAVSVLLLGDFNADPPSTFNDTSESATQRVLDFAIESVPQGRRNPLRSAYDIDAKDLYTTWKIRGSDTTKRIIDYIFYSGNLSCQETLRVPSESQLDPTKLPGLRHPSDHMMIGAKFRIE